MIAFDDIFIESSSTKQIHTLEISNQVRMVTFRDDKPKITIEKCQEEVNAKLESKGFDKEQFMIDSVQVRMMKLGWLNRNNKSFLDLVSILNENQNKAIF